MLGKIHSTSGGSFRGVAEYLLDVLKEENERRVAWVETRNLGTRDGMTAARVMAATHYNQADLKEAAGVAKVGRKSEGAVMHLSISWKEDEVENLTREKMLEVADLAISKFGKDSTRGKNVPKHGGRRQFGDQHQALIVCHDDKDHPHVHIVINRVHPEHGVMLPTAFDRLKLSKVGLKFEKENNKIVCPERVINWEARENGQFVRAKKELPRETWEKMNRLHPELEKRARIVLEQERKKAASIAQAARVQKQRHRNEWARLEQNHVDRATGLVQLREERSKIEWKQINKRFLDQRRQQFHERQAELTAYALREKTALGKVKNRLQGIDVKALMGLEKGKEPDGRVGTWKEAFNVLGSSGAALQTLKKGHEITQKRTDRQEKRDIRQSSEGVRQEFRTDLAEHRQTLEVERSDLLFKQRVEVSKTRAEWRSFDAVRSTNWEPLQSRNPHQKTAVTAGRAKASDFMPKEGSGKAASIAQDRKEKLADRLRQKRQKKEQEKGKGGTER